jgi:hypothetical protein
MVIMLFSHNGLNYLSITIKPGLESQVKNAQISINFNKLSKIDFLRVHQISGWPIGRTVPRSIGGSKMRWMKSGKIFFPTLRRCSAGDAKYG